MLVYGLAGMRDNDGTLSFWPRRAPEENAILRFPVTYRGQLLEVEIHSEKVQYTLREGERLVIRHETEELRVTPEQPTVTRPVSGWKRQDPSAAPGLCFSAVIASSDSNLVDSSYRRQVAPSAKPFPYEWRTDNRGDR